MLQKCHNHSWYLFHLSPLLYVLRVVEEEGVSFVLVVDEDI